MSEQQFTSRHELTPVTTAIKITTRGKVHRSGTALLFFITPRYAQISQLLTTNTNVGDFCNHHHHYDEERVIIVPINSKLTPRKRGRGANDRVKVAILI